MPCGEPFQAEVVPVKTYEYEKLDLAVFRVVVKRSKQAPLLAGKKPSTAILGKSSRFDIYTKRAIG